MPKLKARAWNEEPRNHARAFSLGMPLKNDDRNVALNPVDDEGMVGQVLESAFGDQIVALDAKAEFFGQENARFERDDVADFKYVGAFGDDVRRIGMAQTQTMPNVALKKPPYPELSSEARTA